MAANWKFMEKHYPGSRDAWERTGLPSDAFLIGESGVSGKLRGVAVNAKRRMIFDGSAWIDR